MIRLTIKELIAHKLRLLATAFAVIIGVAFLGGTLTLTDTVMGTFDSLLAKADAGTDAYVRGESPLDLGFGSGRPRIPMTLIDQVRHVDGVREVAPRVSGYAQILDKNGKAVGDAQTGVLGMNWATINELNPFRLTAGHAPSGPNEIVIDKNSADKTGLSPGDRTTVMTGGQPRPATIVGIAKFGSADSPGGTAMVLFDDATAQAVLASPGQIDGIAVVAADGVSEEQLVARLKPLIGASGEAITGHELLKEDQDKVHQDIGAFGTFMTIFAGIAMFVAAFIINNTFSIIVSQRTKEMALLRAIGASGRQVRRAVLIEAAVVGLSASAIGLVAGIGVAKALQALLGSVGLDIPAGATVVSTSTVVISVVAGFVVTVVSAVMPARRASRVAPIAALRDVAQDRSAVSKRRAASGAGITGLGVATLLAGLAAKDVKAVGLGAVVLFLGVSVFGPVLARPVAAVLGQPMARLRGMAGFLARQNAMRNPKRTARTASSLMIGVGLVSFITIFATSAKASGSGALREDFQGSVVVDSGAFDASSGLSPEFAATLTTRPGVSIVSQERVTSVEIDGKPNDIFKAYDTATIGKLFNLGHVQGDLEHLGPDGIAVKAKDGKGGPKLGDKRTVTFSTGSKTFVVRALYDHSAWFLGNEFVDLSAFTANLPTQLDSRVFIDADNIDTVNAQAAPYPTAKVMTTEEFITQQQGKINTILKLIYALLGLAVFIALLGIANTLALSIHERKRELGLLRAVGMSRAQVRSSVRWESVIIALFGTALGLTIGVFLGWAMMHALGSEGVNTFVIPFGSLAVITVIAAIAGVGAAVMPARRAARIDILTAIASS
jgi:putative ABC transport system permease protein